MDSHANASYIQVYILQCSKVVPVVTSFSDAVAKDEHFILSGLPIILSPPFGLRYVSEQLRFTVHCTPCNTCHNKYFNNRKKKKLTGKCVRELY